MVYVLPDCAGAYFLQDVMAGKKRSSGKKSGDKGKALKRGVPGARTSPGPALLCAVLAACVAVGAYLNSLSGEFFLDNAVLIRDNPMVSNPEMAGEIFTSDYWAPRQASNLYRPLTILTYRLQYPESPEELSPEPYHAFNLVLHTLNALLAFGVLLVLSRAVRVWADWWHVAFAGFGAALFAAHPIATEAVTNTVGRADLLVMFFLLLGLLLHMRGSTHKGAAALWHHIGAAACMAGGLLSKENAVAMIAILPLYDVLFIRPRRPRCIGGFGRWLLQRLKTCYGFYALVAAGWLLARYMVLHDLAIAPATYADNPLRYVPLLQREATAVVVLGLYLWRMLWPVTLSADYSAEQIPAVQSMVDARFLGSMAALALIGVAAVLMWRRERMAAFLILFFFIAIFPVSNVVVLTGTIGAERLLYVSSLGWAGCIALGGVYAAMALRRKFGEFGAALPCVLLGIIVILYGVRTHLRNEDWRDKLTFWRTTAATSDRSARALCAYARALYEEHREENLGECRRLLERAVGITDRYVAAHATLGTVYNTMAKTALAGNDRLAAAEYLDRAGEVLRRGIEQDRVQESERRRRMGAGGRGAGPLLVGNWRLYLALGDIWATRSLVALERDERADALERARENYRIVVLVAPHSAKANTEYAWALMRMAGGLEGDEKTRMLQGAAVSLWRAIIADELYAKAWKLLRDCYRQLGHDPQELLVSRGGRFDYVRGDNENRRCQIRALRSLIMIYRAQDPSRALDWLLDIARGFGIAKCDLAFALAESIQIDAPRVLRGE